MSTSTSPSYDELKRRLEAAESALQAIREGRVDTILGEREALVVRLAKAEAREAHLKQVLLAIRNVNQLIVVEDDPLCLIEQACGNLTETMGYHNAWIALLGGEAARGLGLQTEGPVAAAAAAGFDGGFEILRKRLERGQFPNCMARAMESGDTLVKGNPAADCSDCPLHGQYGGRAGLVRRLEADGVTYGILTVSVPAAYARDDEEQDFFNEVADDLAFALYKITAARKLEENRQHLALVIEGSDVGTWEWNVRTNETRFNEQWAAMLGYTIEELTPYDYATWERLVHPGDLGQASQALADCVEGRTTDYNCEFRMRHKDGRWVWILDRGRIMTRDDVGKALSLFGTHTDITDLKQTEESLRRQHAMLARTEALAHVGSWAWEAEGDKVTWSEELFRIFGLEPREQAPPFAEHQAFYVPADRARLAKAVEDCLQNGVPYALEVRFTRTDGQLRHCIVRGIPEHGADGAVNRLYGSLHDITEIKRARERIAILGHMLDEAPASITIHDTEGRFLYANRKTVALHGYADLDELLKINLHELDVPESEALLAERFRKINEAGEARFDVKHYRKDGSTFPLEVLAKQIEWKGRPAVLSIATDITERKQAMETQRHANELMQYIIEHTNSAVAVHDRDLHYMYVSKRYLKDYGVQAQEIIGKHHYDVFPDLPEKWRKVHRKALAGEVSSSERDPYERADGTVEWTRWACRPWYEANGSIGGIIVYTEVITERVQAEEALRKSEQRYRILFEEALNPILLVDENGHYVDANDAALQFMECERKNLMGRSVWDFAPPGIIERQKQEHSPFLKRRTLETGYMIHGRIKTLLLNVVPLEVGGRTVLCGIGQDITERKQAEKVLVRQQRSIKLSSQIASVFLISSRNEVFADVLDVLLSALESRFGYFGYIDEAGDLVCPSMTREIWDQCQVPEKSIVFPRADWGGLWGRSMMEKQTLVANENLRIPEGHVALENALATPIVHHDKLIGQFVVADKAGGYNKDDRDLLESVAAQTAPILFAIQEEARQKKAHEKLEEQMRQAQKMEAVGRLAGGVAHDFNNMLGIILGHADMLLEEMDPDQALYADLTEIRKAGERSADLTRQLLAFARKQTVAPKVIDLNKTVAGMLNMLQRLIGEDIDMAWIPGEKMWPVKIDPTQIDQVLANLCVNARDAIADVGKVTIETGNIVFDEEYCKEHAGFVPGEYTLLTVSDNGCGMNAETLENIFEPFFTTKESDKGTGLGLATVYGVVKQNNGFINVYSEPGQGTTFRIYLPRHRTKEVRWPDKEAIRPAARGHETILLVEDEPAILRMTTMMLERTGYTVLAAGTPGEAIALAREHAGDIHLLMTDVVMPEMNGRDLAKNLLSLYPNIKLLFMSGYTANVIAHHGVLDEGVQFIQKPFSKTDLGVKVRAVLDRK